MPEMACPNCGAVFEDREDLRAHRARCTGNFTPPDGIVYPFRCGKCGQKFETELALGAHAPRCHAQVDE